VEEAKKDIAKERSTVSESSGIVGNVQQQPHKRFDLKSLRQNQSFKKFFGGDDSPEANTRSSSSAAQGVPTIMEDAPEDEAEARDLPQASSSTDQATAMPSIMRQRSNMVANDDGEDRPSYASARRTGIPVERTETTDSQVRFGHLPKPSRR